MRVIAGKCRSLPLKSVPGNTTRPTTDRIKETLFNILQSDIPGALFLDLFAGSGAIGIEALSRGAAHAWFVDHDPKAIRVIKDNLQFTRLEENADVFRMNAADAASFFSVKILFDVVFLDPPYGQGLEKEIFHVFRKSGCTDSHTLFVTEASLETSFDWLQEEGYTVIKEKCYKTNKHVFAKMKKEQI
ncbi:MAG: 16S rRNA (guanine(966)-N(2))-methyltransferase RsmD [Eubacterium sp.]|nr:16S rRNA (guanine(966)-N(2))-methyltransferase RsmD [Eubacterium sp.]